MSDNNILLGKRHFLSFRETKINIEGWTFTLPEKYHFIAGGSDGTDQIMISLFRESEKMAQLSLINNKSEVNLVIQVISSDVIIEISELQHMVAVVEKN